MDSLMLRRRAINLNLDAYINFADPVVAEMCIDAWGDGTGLTRRQAMFVTNTQFGQVFNGTETGITSFDEMRLFAGLTQVPASAFKGCADLISVILPSGVTRFNGMAFEGCESLSSINMIQVNRLAYNAFKGCTSLTDVNMPNLSYSLDTGTFEGSGITKITSLGILPEMGGYNFRNCKSLKNVIIPATVTNMGQQQFQGCSNLETAIIHATTPPTYTYNIFRDCGDAKVYVPYSEDHSILAAYQAAWNATYDVPRLAELDENGNIPE